jgi:Flp pilus assembly protein TadG
LLKRFSRDDKGTVVVLFAFMFPLLVIAMGAAIDMGRWLHAQHQTQGALDAGVLAGARELQVTGDEAKAIIAARNTYTVNVASRIPLKNPPSASFNVTTQDGVKQMNGAESNPMKMLLLPVIHVNEMPVIVKARSQVRAGGKSKSALEVSVMLDVTGSMCSPCEKLDAMKDAATDLIKIVVSEDQGEFTSKAALVPFSETINLGSYFNTVMNGGPAAPPSKSVEQKNGQTRDWYRTATCVVERTGIGAYLDTAPSGNNFPLRAYTPDGKCNPNDAKFVPLTADKQRLLDAIRDLKTSGNTAGHIGTAWAWYALSPNWASRFPAASRPMSYGDIATGKVRKIAVLMTDGEYNVQYCSSGVPDKNSNFNDASKGKCTAPNGSATSQAKRTCASMKDAGIEVFAVGFRLGSFTAREALEDCASGETYFYDAKDEDQLRQAYRDIALKISDIYLSQ